MAAGRVIMPDDYQSLLAESGPGTLAGALRLLAPGGPEGFSMQAGQESVLDGHSSLLTLGMDRGLWGQVGDPDEDEDDDDARALGEARLWGIFGTGETCWWLPIRDDPAKWLVVIVGNGYQQLNISTTDFLRRWVGGRLDLPVLGQGAVPREWRITPAGRPVTVPDVPDVARDPLAQWKTIVGPGHATPVSFDWAAIEADLGRPLPPDCKLLHETYGSLTRGVTDNCKALCWNGITIHSPLRLREAHEWYAENGVLARTFWEPPPPDFPAAEDLLLCCMTESRELLAWDTRNPDPARWPVISLDYRGPRIFPGTLTELLIADLTGGDGLCLTDSSPGDPAGWAYPYWGPDAPWGS